LFASTIKVLDQIQIYSRAENNLKGWYKQKHKRKNVQGNKRTKMKKKKKKPNKRNKQKKMYKKIAMEKVSKYR
jgi:hypothetical protein